MQVDDRIHAGLVQKVDVSGNRVPIIGPAVRGRRPVDPEPAVLVHRNSYCVHVPAGDRRDRGGVTRPVEEAIVGHALVLHPRCVHEPDGHQAPGEEEDAESEGEKTRKRGGVVPGTSVLPRW